MSSNFLLWGVERSTNCLCFRYEQVQWFLHRFCWDDWCELINSTANRSRNMYSIETFDLFIFHENIEYNMMLLIFSLPYTSIRLKTPSYNTNHTTKNSTEVNISNDVCIDTFTQETHCSIRSQRRLYNRLSLIICIYLKQFTFIKKILSNHE